MTLPECAESQEIFAGGHCFIVPVPLEHRLQQRENLLWVQQPTRLGKRVVVVVRVRFRGFLKKRAENGDALAVGHNPSELPCEIPVRVQEQWFVRHGPILTARVDIDIDVQPPVPTSRTSVPQWLYRNGLWIVSRPSMIRPFCISSDQRTEQPASRADAMIRAS
jgi:hypothetical protein